MGPGRLPAASLEPKGDHTATLLPNGKVLAAGGFSATDFSASAELYDPTSGIWIATGSLADERSYFTSTLLANGKVLAVGGETGGGSDLASAELYDPATGSWSTTGSLAIARAFHTATLLARWQGISRRRLLIPRAPNFTTQPPALGQLQVALRPLATFTGRCCYPMARCSSLADSLLTARGDIAWPAPNSTIPRPASGPSRVASSARGRFRSFSLLPNGKVLAAGGDNNGAFLATSELYDPTTRTWSATGSLVTARYAGATLLPNGQVLAAGGGIPTTLASAELYDPASGTWSATGSLATARFPPLTLLPNGEVLASGGLDANFTSVTNAELYDIGLGFSNAWKPRITTARAGTAPAHRFTLPRHLASLWRQHPGFVEQLPNRAIAQHRQQPGYFPAR